MADNVASLVEEIMTAVSGALTEGLEGQQAQWTLRAYRTVILPYQLRFAESEGADLRRRRAAIVISDIVGQYGGSDAEAKWKRALVAYYHARLAPLSEAVFELAQEVDRSGEASETAVQEATKLHGEFIALRDEMERDAPSALQALSDTLSECLVDCKYILRDRSIVSLRLNRVIESRASSGRCPNCGSSNAPGSRFCVQCGTPLTT